MTRVGYVDLASGTSGDMLLACLAHAGRRLGAKTDDAIADAVESLDLDAHVTFHDEERGGMRCLRADVKTGAQRYTPAELRAAIERADVADAARGRALASLDVLVAAEASVHGVDAADVHLHELASADTAADLLGAAAGFDALQIERIVSAPVPVPNGWIAGEHGALPVPAPATLEILRAATLRGVDATKELVTPSGAAILVGHDAAFGTAPELVLEAVGVGAGSRTTDESGRPNICRLLIGAPADLPDNLPADVERCVVLEANIDDQTPEALGHAINALVDAGALDAWVTPIVMKKSRPAFTLSVLVRPPDEPAITERFFRVTSTLGVRRRETIRTVLDRETVTVAVDGHDVRVKVARMRGEITNVAPEADDCAIVAERTGASFADVMARATARARDALA
jgi:uncharacterized protein (TIGR00299 family) protein